MEKPADVKYTEELLREAMELLEDLYPKLGMFERQHFMELKKRVEQHEALTVDLRKALNEIC
ncbi:hypothetical protein [Mucilaginibacter sp. HD30]